MSYWQAHDLCSSGIGLLGSALSGSFASSCSAVNLIWAGSLLAIGIGVVLLLSGLFARGQAPRAPTPRPDWSSPQAGAQPAASLPPATGALTYPARLANGVSVLASGNPHRMARRAKNKVLGRTLALGGFWRLLWAV
jgi:hypothetical protein